MLQIQNGKTIFNPHTSPTIQNKISDSILSALSMIQKEGYMDKPSAIEIQNSIIESLSWLEDQGISYFVECFGDEDTLEIVTSIDTKDIEGLKWNTH